MKKNGALGVIEVLGYGTAIVAADAALKAANVKYFSYFKSGSGSIQVRFAGDVGAIQAAIAAAKTAASAEGVVFGDLVIPRPHEDLKKLIERYGLKKNPAFTEPEAEEPAEETPEVKESEVTVPEAGAAPEAEEPAEETPEAEEPETEAVPEEEEPAEETPEAEEPEAVAAPEAEGSPEGEPLADFPTGTMPEADGFSPKEPASKESDAENLTADSYTCNLCKDPACSRMRGQPRRMCIHYKES